MPKILKNFSFTKLPDISRYIAAPKPNVSKVSYKSKAFVERFDHFTRSLPTFGEISLVSPFLAKFSHFSKINKIFAQFSVKLNKNKKNEQLTLLVGFLSVKDAAAKREVALIS